MKLWKNKFVWVMAFVPILIIACVYGKLPAQIPMHWSVGGEVSYKGREMLWVLGLMGPVFAVLFRFIPRIDPRKRNYEKFMGAYLNFQIGMMLFVWAMTGIVIAQAIKPESFSVWRAVLILIALLFILIGNMMPKFRFNYFVGIKTPWTLASETVWNRTHRIGGRLLFSAGILALPMIFLPEKIAFSGVMAVVLIAVFIPCILSWKWYQSEEKTNN